ncbi:MAG: hypothetical protein NUV73_04475 [Candidatus Daviesbacteria bacterium]|nr:hypothetical protein [Candidatus Daviesbacteria bacterium]
MNRLKLLYLWFRWLFFDTEPYAVTFEAYLDKVKIDQERKKCGDPPLKDRIHDYHNASRAMIK